MPTTVTIQASQAFTRGVTIYAPRNVPLGTTSVQLLVDRSAFTGDPVARTGDGAVAFSIGLFLSLDSGTSWTPCGNAGSIGGVLPDSTASGFLLDIPNLELSTRQMAAILAVTGPITLGITATVFP